MKLTDIFIRRPVFATVISLLIFLMGLIALQKIPIRQFPKIESSVININASYPGASAELMEGFVTTPIESTLSSLEGVNYIYSTSRQAQTSISVVFQHGYDVDKAVSEVNSRVSSARYRLPRDMNDPIIAKQNPDSNPIIFIPFTSKSMDPKEISDYLLRVIQPQLEVLPGVGQARILGERRYAMRIWLDPNLLIAHKVTANDIETALRANNVQTTAGLLSNGLYEYSVNAETDLKEAKEFENLVIREENQKLVRLGDVAKIELGIANNRFSVIMDGQSAVAIGIVPKSDANPLNIAKELNTIMPSLIEQLPEGLTAQITWDSTRFIDASINEVVKTIVEAILFVVLIIFLFLGSIRAAIIPSVVIPIALIGVCSIMFALNYSINTLTLLAWVLAIGIVVDDAIVVLENIHRNVENGMAPKEAALVGAREIRFAVIAMTLTLAAVYAPIGFMGGVTGTLFREFAFTLASAVIISGVIALTLSPMMCSKLLVQKNAESKLSIKIEYYLDKIQHFYHHWLAKALARKKLMVIAGILIYLACFTLFKLLKTELAPPEDQSVLVGFISGPTSANLEFTKKYTNQLIPIYESLPEMKHYGIINGFGGVNSGLTFVVLEPWSERKRNATAILGEIMGPVFSIPGIRAFVTSPPSLPIGSFTPVEFVIQTTGSYEELNTVTQQLLMAARQNPRLINPDTDLKITKPEVKLVIDRNKAADLGISMDAIGGSLRVFLSEPQITRFAIRGRNYDVIPQLMPEYRDTNDRLSQLQVRTRSGELIPLSNIVEIEEVVAPLRLDHFQQLRSSTLKASLAPGYTLGEALAFLEAQAKPLLTDQMKYDFAGESRQLKETGQEVYLVFIYALVFIYLVLCAQFESFRSPLIIMISVPLCFSGALFAMYLTGSTLNIYTQIGLVTLIGLIAKHGILIVEFANQLQEAGKQKYEALVEACGLRLRPILMTTAATVLAAIPLVLASGAGAASRQQIGWTIIGGMSLGTLFTLFIIPVAYLYLGKNYQSMKQG